jgi:hypothetical protein
MFSNWFYVRRKMRNSAPTDDLFLLLMLTFYFANKIYFILV